MIICQSIRKVLHNTPASTTGVSRTLATMSMLFLAAVLSLGSVSPAFAKGGDNDNDGLANGAEGKYGTERKNPDTDGDGLLDGYEVYTSLSDPTVYDSDADGLSDGAEIATGTGIHNPDTDGDGLYDGVEFQMYGTSPLYFDTDYDSLNDYVEIFVTETDPTNWDTDGDQVEDGFDRFPNNPWFS